MASTHPLCRELEAAIASLGEVEKALGAREPPGQKIAAFLEMLKSVEKAATDSPPIPFPAAALEKDADWEALTCATLHDALAQAAESSAKRAHARDLADLVENAL